MNQPLFMMLDIETTGLDPQKHQPIQVAWGGLDEPLTEWREELCGSPLTVAWRAADPQAAEMHRKSGLHERWVNATQKLTFHGIDVHLSEWITSRRQYGQKVHLCGNTVSFDMGFVRKYFPKTAQLLHHRMLDVSAVMLFLQSIGVDPEKVAPKKQRAHTAKEDLVETLSEYAYYKSFLLEHGVGTVGEPS